MTRRNTEIKFIQSGTGYNPMSYGKYAGQPTVSVKLSSSSQNSWKVNSLESMFINNNWKQKITSGYARLRIYGNEPFSEEHQESIEYLIDVLKPRFLDMEVKDTFIDEEPSTYIHRKTDTYTFFIDATKSETRYDPSVLKEISDKYAKTGNVQYVFKVDSAAQEDKIRRFRKDYTVYDSEIWLYPKGRKAESVFESREAITPFAKRNKWNVSPRLDIGLDELDQSE